MPNRRPSINAALRTNRELGKLFARLGTAEHPRGKVLVAYRNARRAMRDVLRRHSLAMILEAREVMAGLKDSVRTTADTTLRAAHGLGMSQAQVEASVWGLGSLAYADIDLTVMSNAILGIVDQQERGILATLAIGTDPALILGSDTTVGLLRPDTVTREGARWLATAAGLALIGALQPAMESSGRAWGKQAIAAIDAVTTDCCLGVHGQVVPENKKFYTAGSPAWAAWQDWSPFHWNCRTSVGMVPLDEADDDLTAMLLEQSAGERKKRQEARLRISEIMDELVGKGTIPDARRRRDDTAAITELREELRALRQRGGYPGWTGKAPVPPVAKATWRPGMDLEQSSKWLNSTESLNPDLTSEENAALEWYKGEGFYDINSDLRMAGYSEDERAGIIEAAINRGSLDQSITVFRGADWDTFDEYNLIGDIITDNAFVSTSLSERVASAHGENVILEIQVPKGAHALNMEHWGVTGWAQGEAEILLQREARFKILADNIDDDPDIRQILLELLL